MKYELSHDSIAKQIFEKASFDAKARRKADAFLDRAFVRYQEKKVLLTEADLEELRPFWDELNISEEEALFIHRSRRHLRRKRRRNWILALSAIVVLTIAFLIASVTSVNLKQRGIELKLSSEKNQYNSVLFGTTVLYELEADATKSLQTALQYPDRLDAYFGQPQFQEVFFDAYLQGVGSYVNPFYQLVDSTTSNILAIQYDPKGMQQAAYADGTIIVRNAAGKLLVSNQELKGDYAKAVFAKAGDRLALYPSTATNQLRLVFLEEEKARTLESKYGAIDRVIMGPKGGHQATITKDQTIEVWDSTGTYRGVLKQSEGAVVDAQFSDDGQLFFTHIRAKDADSLLVYRMDTPDLELDEKPISADRGSITAITFSTKLNSLVYAQRRTIYSFPDYEIVRDNDFFDRVNHLKFLQNGRCLLSVTDEVIKIWNFEAFYSRRIRPTQPSSLIPTKGVKVEQIIPIGDDLFAVQTAENVLNIYTVYGEQVIQLSGPESNIEQVAIHDNGPLISTMHHSGHLYNWLLPSASALHPEFRFAASLFYLQFQADTSKAIPSVQVYNQNQRFLFDPLTQKVLERDSLAAPIIAIGNGAAANTFVIAYANGELELWSSQNGASKKLRKIGSVGEEIAQWVQLPGEAHAALLTMGRKLWLLSATGPDFELEQVPTETEYASIFIAPGLYAFAGQVKNGPLDVFDGKTLQPIAISADAIENISTVHFSDTEQTLWLGGARGVFSRIDLTTGTEKKWRNPSFSGSVEQLYSLADQHLVLAKDGQIRFLKINDSSEEDLSTIIPEGQFSSRWIQLLPFDGGRHLLGFAEAGQINIWNAQGELVRSMHMPYGEELAQVVVAPDISAVVCLTRSGLLKTWDLRPEVIYERLQNLQILPSD
ncbi:MAG: WD40 repeat domain-containing protein [Bacteroidota bacterium]